LQVGSATETYGLPEENRKVAKTLDKEAFLQLFIAQLKNQDPMSPQDSGAFVTQLAQFSMLEQLANLSEEITELKRFQEMSEASALLGREVTIAAGGEAVSGRVEKVTYGSEEGVLIVVNGAGYGLSQVTEIR